MSKVVHVPDEVASRLAAEAERMGVSEDELAARLLADHLPRHPATRTGSLAGLIGLGSGEGDHDIARRHKEIRRGELAENTVRDE